MADSAERFPLFPLGLVLLPGELVPLHIFEERYRTMIGECLEQASEFGIVWSGDDGLADIGCAAEVAQLIEELDDGRMNVLVKGTRPFRLNRRIEDMPYPAGDVEWLAADDEEDPDADEDVAVGARRAYADLVEKVTELRPTDEDLAELDAYGMAATIAFDLSDKQELLELRAEEDRLDRLAALCGSAMKRLSETGVAAARASSNGKVHY